MGLGLSPRSSRPNSMESQPQNTENQKEFPKTWSVGDVNVISIVLNPIYKIFLFQVAVFWTGIRSKNGYKITNIYGVNLGINTCVLVPVLFVFVVELQYSQCGQEATNDDVFRWRRYFPAFFFLILSWSEALEFYISVAVVGFSSALQFYSLLLLIVYFIILEKTK